MFKNFSYKKSFTIILVLFSIDCAGFLYLHNAVKPPTDVPNMVLFDAATKYILIK